MSHHFYILKRKVLAHFMNFFKKSFVSSHYSYTHDNSTPGVTDGVELFSVYFSVLMIPLSSQWLFSC